MKPFKYSVLRFASSFPFAVRIIPSRVMSFSSKWSIAQDEDAGVIEDEEVVGVGVGM